ncbi:MAG: PDZ domain-containing protein, partial [Oscillospiraceae bacterium]|nr:PDZ domain-containing protein [Oscillospiraceae bacterium]
MRKKRFSPISILVTAALSVLCALGAVALAAWLLLGSAGLSILQGVVTINTQFVGEYDADQMADAALDAMVESLGDRWSYYMDADSYTATVQRRSNSYVGIGVTVMTEEGGLRIQSVTEGGPADLAGLLVGELITAADGTDLSGDNAELGTSLIQGEEGTQVTLTVEDAQGASRQVTIVRAQLQTDPVSYEMLEDSIGYVALSNFYSGSAEIVEAAVEDLLSQGAASLIFDMRDNPGGYLSELLDLLDYLLPEGDIFQSGDSSGPTRVTTSDEDCVDVPMAVLVNGNTYSAAELFAAQLQESVGASIVGEATYGKGYSQQVFELLGGRALNLSTKTYYTGSGVSLIGPGVTLDVEGILAED